MISSLIDEMIAYDKGDPRRIQHFMKVHDFARTIGQLEGLDEQTLYILESAAVMHDIGIHICEEKYGSCEGKLQEKEGPALAKEMLERLGYEQEVINRICYLVGHHHTYTNITGIDYQILVEADFLVNMCEDELSEEALQNAYRNIFRTETGKKICREMYDIA